MPKYQNYGLRTGTYGGRWNTPAARPRSMQYQFGTGNVAGGNYRTNALKRMAGGTAKPPAKAGAGQVAPRTLSPYMDDARYRQMAEKNRLRLEAIANKGKNLTVAGGSPQDNSAALAAGKTITKTTKNGNTYRVRMGSDGRYVVQQIGGGGLADGQKGSTIYARRGPNGGFNYEMRQGATTNPIGSAANNVVLRRTGFARQQDMQMAKQQAQKANGSLSA